MENNVKTMKVLLDELIEAGLRRDTVQALALRQEILWLAQHDSQFRPIADVITGADHQPGVKQ